MNRLRQKLTAFMYGRYGVDELYFFLLVVYFVLFVVNCFLTSSIIRVILWGILLLALLRSMSKNYTKRRHENEVFLKLFRPVKAEAVLLKDRVKDFRTARYRKCPHCHITLKLPRKRGKHTVVCPKCRERMSVNIII
ncbi:MAG: hypothetical protein E7638_07375 [Ruminococcaceae bacterium]|nr:hypothetical protein [Oscillospiraceae bacterium]